MNAKRECLLLRLLELILRKLVGPPHIRLDYKIQIKNKGNLKMEVTITNEQKVNVTLVPRTAGGHPAPIDGVPAWAVNSGDGTVVPAEDGLSADLISSDAPGDTVYGVSADADLGQGVTTITGEITVHVVQAEASDLGVTVGAPQPK